MQPSVTKIIYIYSLSECIQQRRKVDKSEKQDTEPCLMTGGDNTEMDHNQSKLEQENKAVDTAAPEEGTSNPVITSSVHVDDDESDGPDTVYGNEHTDEDDEATKFNTGQQQSGSSPTQSAEDKNTIGDNTDEPVQL